MLSLWRTPIRSQTVPAKSRRLLAALVILVLAATITEHLHSRETSRPQTFAQRLVNDTAAKHRPELIYLGLHAVTPQSQKSVIFAATDPSKIGKESSCGDLDVMAKGVPILEMKGKSTTILEALRDSSGNAIGLIAVGFNMGDGDESRAARLAKEIADELAHQIPSKGRLFEAVQENQPSHIGEQMRP